MNPTSRTQTSYNFIGVHNGDVPNANGSPSSNYVPITNHPSSSSDLSGNPCTQYSPGMVPKYPTSVHDDSYPYVHDYPNTEYSQSQQYVSVQQFEAAKPKRKPKRKNPKDRPKRPLSAYNFFFQEERSKILKSIPDKNKRNDGEGCIRENEGVTVKSTKKKCPHGKISFAELAKLVGKRWKFIPKNQMLYYKKLAKNDSKRYEEEIKEYNLKEENNLNEGKRQKKNQDDEVSQGCDVSSAQSKSTVNIEGVASPTHTEQKNRNSQFRMAQEGQYFDGNFKAGEMQSHPHGILMGAQNRRNSPRMYGEKQGQWQGNYYSINGQYSDRFHEL